MIFGCPNCKTAYDTPVSAIGSGKKVRCSKCNHMWHQQPVADQPPPVTASQQPASPGYYPPVYPPVSPYGASPMPYPPPGYPPPAYPQMPMENQGGQQNIPSNLIPGQQHTDARQKSDLPKEAEIATKANEPTPSQEELDRMFGTDDDLATMTTLPGGGQGSPKSIRTSADLDDEINPDNIPDDLDPIPEVFTGAGQTPGHAGTDQPKKSRIGLIIGIIVFVLLGLTAGGGVLFKDLVIKAVPATKEIYSMIGLGPARPGEGLIISNEKARRQSQGEGDDAVEILVITGVITNVTNKEDLRAGGKVVEGSGRVVDVPIIKVSLKDKKDNEVQSTSVTPEKNQLKPGEKLRFKVEIKKPSPLARKIEAGFISPVEENK